MCLVREWGVQCVGVAECGVKSRTEKNVPSLI